VYSRKRKWTQNSDSSLEFGSSREQEGVRGGFTRTIWVQRPDWIILAQRPLLNPIH
jgi:hypothetical protein